MDDNFVQDPQQQAAPPQQQNYAQPNRVSVNPNLTGMGPGGQMQFGGGAFSGVTPELISSLNPEQQNNLFTAMQRSQHPVANTGGANQASMQQQPGMPVIQLPNGTYSNNPQDHSYQNAYNQQQIQDTARASQMDTQRKIGQLNNAQLQQDAMNKYAAQRGIPTADNLQAIGGANQAAAQGVQNLPSNMFGPHMLHGVQNQPGGTQGLYGVSGQGAPSAYPAGSNPPPPQFNMPGQQQIRIPGAPPPAHGDADWFANMLESATHDTKPVDRSKEKYGK